MIEGVKPYTEYRESGHAWLGAVPAHWSLLPNRALFTEINDRNHPDEEMLSVTINRGVVPQQELLEGTSKKDSSNSDRSAYKLVLPGDLVYNKMRAWQGAIGISEYRGIVSPAYVVMRPRDSRLAPYFHHLFRTSQFAKEGEGWSYGITSDMWTLRPEHFKMIYSPVPQPDEHTAIIRFLNEANRRIDRAIEAKQRLIALLNEQKQGIIQQAVTRGIEPGVTLKPSGILSLGDVPAHWDVLPLRHVLAFGPRNGISPAPATGAGTLSFSISAVQDGRIQIDGNEKYVDVREDLASAFQIAKGDILLVRGNGNITLVAKCGLVTEPRASCIYPDILMKLRPNRRISAKYLVMAINSAYVSSQVPALAKSSNGAFKVSNASVRSLVLVVPPRAEQDVILAKVSADIDGLAARIGRVESEISLLREYRARLIFDAVTGLTDVAEMR